MYDIINNNKEVTQVSETSISFYLIWLRLKNPSVIHKKTTTEFIYIIFLFHNFFPFGYPVWMPIFNTKVCKRSCRWQVLCIICITLFHHNLSVLFFSVSFIFCISCSDCFICSSSSLICSSFCFICSSF